MVENDDTQPGTSVNSNQGADGEAAKPTDASGSSIESLEQALAKAKNDFLYLYAEFENYKKNSIKERADIRKYGSERLIADLLTVLDIFETALSVPPDSTPENTNAFRRGIEMTASELRQALQRHGVEELPAQGVVFDPSVHEALSSEATADLPPGHVTRVFKKPYKLHDRVVRHGQVVVSKPVGS